MSKLFVDQVDPKTATTLTLGTSGDTISIPSGVTIANAGTATGFGVSGKVLQVVQGSFRNGETSTTSGTVVNNGATVTITPSATSSKILVMFTSIIVSPDSSTGAFYDISRAISGGATTAGIIGAAAGAPTTQGLGGFQFGYNVLSTQYVDSPSTTSAITYRLMLARWFGSGTVYMGNGATNDWGVAIEIDGS